jgi:hypothetical protein
MNRKQFLSGNKHNFLFWHFLFVDFKKVHDSVRREVLYNVLIEFRVLMELVKLIKMCLKRNVY